MSHPDGANGARLREIRLAAGFKSIVEASDECNRLAAKLNSTVEPFTPRKLRRFESIGVSNRYGSTPPTYSELSIMMRAFGGSLAYLFWGLPPALYPFDQYEDLLDSYLNPEVLDHVVWLAKLPSNKRSKLLALIKEVASPDH